MCFSGLLKGFQSNYLLTSDAMTNCATGDTETLSLTALSQAQKNLKPQSWMIQKGTGVFSSHSFSMSLFGEAMCMPLSHDASRDRSLTWSIFVSSSHADYCRAGDGQDLCDISKETLMSCRHDKDIGVTHTHDLPCVCRFMSCVANVLTGCWKQVQSHIMMYHKYLEMCFI